jgi:acyl carrier protein
VEPAAQQHWAVLDGIRADALDCLQTTLAVVADRANGTGTHLALGSRLDFPARHDDGTVRVQPSLRDRLADAQDLLGLRLGTPSGTTGATELAARLDRHGALYVVADTWHLPWLPYAGRRHMRHSFLLEPEPTGYRVVDAYHNETAWGPARPGIWSLSVAELRDTLRGGAVTVTVEPADPPVPVGAKAGRAVNAERARAAVRDLDRYLRAATPDRSETAEQLVLDIWLLARSRALHAAWLAGTPGEAAAKARSAHWQALCAQSYLAVRRFGRTGTFNPDVLDGLEAALRADQTLVLDPGTGPDPAGGDPVTRAVIDAVGSTLRLDYETVRGARTFRDLPGFTSFRLVEIIDRIERRLCVELPAEVTANDLGDVAGLCRLFAGAPAGAGR